MEMYRDLFEELYEDIRPLLVKLYNYMLGHNTIQ